MHDIRRAHGREDNPLLRLERVRGAAGPAGQ